MSPAGGHGPQLPLGSADGLDVVEHVRLLDPDLTDGTEALWEQASDPTVWSGPDAISSLGARARAVAYTRPLHDLAGTSAT